MMPRALFSFVLTCAVTFGASAQPADLPTPEALFDEATQAIGWTHEAIGEIGRIEAFAHVTVEGRTYDTLVNSRVDKPAGGDATFTMISDDGRVTYGDTAGTIWFEGGDGNRKTLANTMAAFVQGHQFHRRALFPQNEIVELRPEVIEATFAGEPAFAVTGLTLEGSTLTYYFHQRTKILLGFQLVVQEESGPHPMEFQLKDWRTSAGQSLFWRIDINDRGKIFVYQFDRILLLPK